MLHSFSIRAAAVTHYRSRLALTQASNFYQAYICDRPRCR